MKKNYLTKNSQETKKVGRILAQEILKKRRSQDQAIVLGLIGDLGGGKTTFLQGFAKGLGIQNRITSPTFVIMKRFRISRFIFHNFYHFDCYRVKEPKELLDLDFEKIISIPQNIVAVEWADRVRDILPRDALILEFEFIDEKTRKIVLK